MIGGLCSYILGRMEQVSPSCPFLDKIEPEALFKNAAKYQLTPAIGQLEDLRQQKKINKNSK